jgi:hypothetical protein
MAVGVRAREQTIKKTPSPIPLLLYEVIAGTDPKENNSSFHCCVAKQRL